MAAHAETQPADQAAILTLDLGSSRLKAAWVSTDGKTGPIHATDSPARLPEASPEHIWQNVTQVLATLLRAPEAPRKVLSISLTSLTRTHVLLDEHRQVCGPLIRWDNPYGESYGDEVAAAYGLPASTAGLGAFHPLARLCQARQDRGRPPASLLELRDWLNFRLTGRLATDAVAYGRLQQNGHSAVQALQHLKFAPQTIPPAQAPDTRLGVILEQHGPGLARLVGVPVTTGSFDTWCSTLGMGAITQDAVYDISGTTEVMGVFRNHATAVPGAVCLPWTPTLWQVGGPCQTGLGSLAWFARSFLDDESPAATLAAARAARADEPPLCLPYLTGERMPWWNPTLSASFHDTRAEHTRNDFARAVVEGVVLAHRAALDFLSIPRKTTPIYLGGGGSRLPEWCQIRADALGASLRIGDSPESALIGAALAAGVALGYHPNLAAAQDTIRDHSHLVRPDPAKANYFDRRAARFTQLLQQALPYS